MSLTLFQTLKPLIDAWKRLRNPRNETRKRNGVAKPFRKTHHRHSAFFELP